VVKAIDVLVPASWKRKHHHPVGDRFLQIQDPTQDVNCQQRGSYGLYMNSSITPNLSSSSRHLPPSVLDDALSSHVNHWHLFFIIR
jgi:hypothetical protein